MALTKDEFRHWFGDPRPPANRLFGDTPNKILATRIEIATIAAVDEVIERCKHLPRNRSEFVRRAIEEKLAREQQQRVEHDSQ
jgi:hypothetical protein